MRRAIGRGYHRLRGFRQKKSLHERINSCSWTGHTMAQAPRYRCMPGRTFHRPGCGMKPTGICSTPSNIDGWVNSTCDARATRRSSACGPIARYCATPTLSPSNRSNVRRYATASEKRSPILRAAAAASSRISIDANGSYFSGAESRAAMAFGIKSPSSSTSSRSIRAAKRSWRLTNLPNSRCRRATISSRTPSSSGSGFASGST